MFVFQSSPAVIPFPPKHKKFGGESSENSIVENQKKTEEQARYIKTGCKSVGMVPMGTSPSGEGMYLYKGELHLQDAKVAFDAALKSGVPKKRIVELLKMAEEGFQRQGKDTQAKECHSLVSRYQ